MAKDKREFKIVSVPTREGLVDALQITEPKETLVYKSDLLEKQVLIEELLSKFPSE